MPKILVVEDEQQLAEKLASILKFEHYQVEVLHDGADAVELLRTANFDLIILDWNLPNQTGIQICEAFRARGGSAPVLFLTGKGNILDKEQGFQSGGDDYLTKPFHMKELIARVKALLRRPHRIQPPQIKVDRFSLELATFHVHVDGVPVKLLPKEFALLEFLVKHPNQPFNAKALLEAVWESDSKASEDTIRTYIKTLRRKITIGDEECPLKTLPGYGYKLEIPE
jgi:OmpR-family two-component system manganese-sensing response regulator